MFSARDHLKLKLKEINSKISDDLDFDFSAVSERIDTVEQFESKILDDFLSGKKYFYRGEKVNDPERHLVPTMLRNPSIYLKENDLGIVHIDNEYLYNFYLKLGNFVGLFNNTMGKTDPEHMYELCAFAQHYCEFSPLIDFTKSLYPSLSFSLKDREFFENDVVLYVLKLNDDSDYTDNLETANLWLSQLDIYISYFHDEDVRKAVRDTIRKKNILEVSDEFKKHLEHINTNPAPKAKLIDVPINTRMKFQQGVFLLLTDFQLFKNMYFTKNIRQHFAITKYIISKDICPWLNDLVKKEAPWYEYKYLTDIDSAFKTAIYEKR